MAILITSYATTSANAVTILSYPNCSDLIIVTVTTKNWHVKVVRAANVTTFKDDGLGIQEIFS